MSLYSTVDDKTLRRTISFLLSPRLLFRRDLTLSTGTVIQFSTLGVKRVNTFPFLLGVKNPTDPYQLINCTVYSLCYDLPCLSVI